MSVSHEAIVSYANKSPVVMAFLVLHRLQHCWEKAFKITASFANTYAWLYVSSS
jgi:hypothetical protein